MNETAAFLQRTLQCTELFVVDRHERWFIPILQGSPELLLFHP